MMNRRNRDRHCKRSDNHDFLSSRLFEISDRSANREDQRPSKELLSVARAVLTWWQKHKHDTKIEENEVVYCYEFKPFFVSRAEEILKNPFLPSARQRSQQAYEEWELVV